MERLYEVVMVDWVGQKGDPVSHSGKVVLHPVQDDVAGGGIIRGVARWDEGARAREVGLWRGWRSAAGMGRVGDCPQDAFGNNVRLTGRRGGVGGGEAGHCLAGDAYGIDPGRLPPRPTLPEQTVYNKKESKASRHCIQISRKIGVEQVRHTHKLREHRRGGRDGEAHVQLEDAVAVVGDGGYQEARHV